jgi:hypothetical protein
MKLKAIGFCFGIILFISIAAFLGTLLIHQVVFTPPEAPTYTPQEIQSICRLFPSAQQVLCTDLAGQNAIKFNQILDQLFPEGQATYNDIMQYFGTLPSNWWSGLECGNETQDRYAPNNCPAPQFCQQEDWYACVFFSQSGNIPLITVYFNMDGLVSRIGVDTPSSS